MAMRSLLQPSPFTLMRMPARHTSWRRGKAAAPTRTGTRAGRREQVIAARKAHEQDPVFQVRRGLEEMDKKAAKRKRRAEYSREWRARRTVAAKRKRHAEYRREWRAKMGVVSGAPFDDVVIVLARDADSGACF